MKDLTIKEIGKINFGHKNSSWHIQAPLSYIQQNDSSPIIKRKFIYINRAYFSMTKSQAVKKFKSEFNKIKNSLIKPKTKGA